MENNVFHYATLLAEPVFQDNLKTVLLALLLKYLSLLPVEMVTALSAILHAKLVLIILFALLYLILSI